MQDSRCLWALPADITTQTEILILDHLVQIRPTETDHRPLEPVHPRPMGGKGKE